MCMVGGPRCAGHTRQAYAKALQATIRATGDLRAAQAAGDDTAAREASLRVGRLGQALLARQAAYDTTAEGLTDLARQISNNEDDDGSLKARFEAGYASRLRSYQRHDMEAGREVRTDLALDVDGQRWQPNGTPTATGDVPAARPESCLPGLDTDVVPQDHIHCGDHIYYPVVDREDGQTHHISGQVDRIQRDFGSPIVTVFRHDTGEEMTFLIGVDDKIQQFRPPTSADQILDDTARTQAGDARLQRLHELQALTGPDSPRRQVIEDEIAAIHTRRLRDVARCEVPQATSLMLHRSEGHLEVSGYYDHEDEYHPWRSDTRGPLTSTEAAHINHTHRWGNRDVRTAPGGLGGFELNLRPDEPDEPIGRAGIETARMRRAMTARKVAAGADEKQANAELYGLVMKHHGDDLTSALVNGGYATQAEADMYAAYASVAQT